jgi:hypothetical protein
MGQSSCSPSASRVSDILKTTDTPRLTQFSVTKFETCVIKYIYIYIFFETRAESFLARTKAQGDEGARRTLLGDNKGGGAVMLRPIRSQCFGV